MIQSGARCMTHSGAKKQIRKMVKGAKNKTKNKNVVGNDRAYEDASIEEI